MGWESFDVTFGLGPFLQGQMSTAKLKSAYNLLIIGPRGLQCETYLEEIMDWESFDVIRFDLGTLLQGQMRTAKLWIHHRRRPRPQRFLVSDLHSIFLSGFLSYLADGLIW